MADAKALTARSIEALKGGAARVEIRDGGCKNLYLVVQPSSTKSWAWRGRIKGSDRPIKKTIGAYPVLSLADARDRANQITRDAADGIDRAVVAAAEKAAQVKAAETVAERSTKTLRWYWDEHYAPAFVAKSRSAKNQTSMFAQLAPLHSTPLVELTIDKIEDVINPITKRAPAQANRITALLKTMLRRAVTHHRKSTGMTSSPAEYLAKKGEEEKRDRVLSRREQVILAAVIMDPPPAAATYGAILRLMMDTGCRITEARGASWDEIDFDKMEWIIPATRSKNGLTMVVTLATETVEWLRERKAGSNYRWIFPSPKNGDKIMNSVSKSQDAIWTATSSMMAVDGLVMDRWSSHDIRRTFSTGLNEIVARAESTNLNNIVVEACLNHISGAMGGVAGRYNHYSYLREKRLALRLWQDHLITIRAEAKRLVDQPTIDG